MAEITLRPPTLADAEAITALLNEHSRVLYGTADVSVGEIRAWFSLVGTDPGADMRVALDAQGMLVGYADIEGTDVPDGPLRIDMRTLPSGVGSGVAEALLRAMETRAAECGAPHRPLRAWAFGSDDAARTLLEREGYRPVRSSFRMEIDLQSAEPERPTWPDDIVVRSYRGEIDLPRVHAASDEAFADHWEHRPHSLEDWRARNVRETTDTALWFLAEDGGELAGICLCRLDDPPDPGLGWVSTLAVRRPWRRRGLASALLRHAFVEMRARGQDRVGLGVDAENLTGAVALSEGVGMHVARRSDQYEKVWP